MILSITTDTVGSRGYCGKIHYFRQERIAFFGRDTSTERVQPGHEKSDFETECLEKYS